uniref:V-type proton ATPase 116 kDa subunit a 4-like n=1 Tax=Myxine glutinosa TaxID=7769 RepID=UPI0035902E1C
MGVALRSEEMCLAQLFMQYETAYRCVAELGHLGLVQFRDLNNSINAFQRRFVHELRRCEDMERSVRYLEGEVRVAGMFLEEEDSVCATPLPSDMISMETEFERFENELREIDSSKVVLRKNYLELKEMLHLLLNVEPFLAMVELRMADQFDGTHYLRDQSGMHDVAMGLELGFVAGVIAREKLPPFERMLWRVCRGNVYVQQSQIEVTLEDPDTGHPLQKTAFVVFFQGEQLKNKVKLVCEGFRAIIYPCPESVHQRREVELEIEARLLDLQMVLSETEDLRQRVLLTAGRCCHHWRQKVSKMKAIYYTLDLCSIDNTHQHVVAEVWCPRQNLLEIQQALSHASECDGGMLSPIMNDMQITVPPPTFNRTNHFTAAFQDLIDAYGVGKYREVNPAPYTIITFPFLFAVMFGDLGHGVMLFLFALWILHQRCPSGGGGRNEIWKILYSGRYIILLMGIFSIYTGFIYNDCFSKSINIFGSSWSIKPMFEHGGWTEAKLLREPVLQLDPNVSGVYSGIPYPFGIDPIWNLALNKLSFLNSYKMKTSIILGVLHMLFAVTLSVFNHLHFNEPENILLDFIPRILFLLSTFGYLVGTVVYKWCVFTVATSHFAPSLLVHFVDMMRFGKVEEKSRQLYVHQQATQICLLAVAAISTVWMLLLRPFALWAKHQRTRHLLERSLLNGNSSSDLDGSTDVDSEGSHCTDTLMGSPRTSTEEGNGEEFDLAEVFVNQAIHTIEYCLGCISNTASYLRLWALSLAHAQLSEVLWRMVLHGALSLVGPAGPVGISILFAIFSGLTVTILLAMETLSAFLHSLRLHWVEFQNKFYKGSGYKFSPFSFEAILSTLSDDCGKG